MNYKAAKKYILQRLSKELSPMLTYHGLHHTLDVLDVTSNMCELFSMSKEESTLLKTAALFHDAGFMISNENHEEIGCQIVKEMLPSFDYPEYAINQMCGMIMATKIPQSPSNKYEEILCDADLDYLGRNDFHQIAETLFQELKSLNKISSRDDWNKIQISFLANHNYFTKEKQLSRSPQKFIHLMELEEIVADSN